MTTGPCQLKDIISNNPYPPLGQTPDSILVYIIAISVNIVGKHIYACRQCDASCDICKLKMYCLVSIDVQWRPFITHKLGCICTNCVKEKIIMILAVGSPNHLAVSAYCVHDNSLAWKIANDNCHTYVIYSLHTAYI